MRISSGRPFPPENTAWRICASLVRRVSWRGIYGWRCEVDKHEKSAESLLMGLVKEHRDRLVCSVITQRRNGRSLDVLDYTAMVLWQCIREQVEREGLAGSLWVSDSVVRKTAHECSGRGAIVAVVCGAGPLLAARVCIDIWCAAVQEALSGAAVFTRVVAAESGVG